MNFSYRLRDLLENKNDCNRFGKHISQKSFADCIGVSKSTVSLWVCGGTEPSASDIVATAKFFGVTSDYILGLSDKKSYEVTERMNRIMSIIEEIENCNYFERIKKELQ